MDSHGQLYFTIWYGVYHRPTGSLRYASAGHPAAMLVNDSARDREPKALRSHGPPVGLSPTARYRAEECTLPARSRLFIFSDGVYEISSRDGSMLEWQAFQDVLTQRAQNGESALDRLLRFDREFRGDDTLEDDFSILEMTIAAT
jgi:serine phosphatase RsbU (regulator of sigma subunit)